MKVIGIVVEYNPFHNGHLYHIEQTKEKFRDSIIIAIMSGNVVQRGQFSILSKFDKSKLAIQYGVDVVLDLPFIFANQSADIFAEKSIEILNYFNVTDIVFGSETNNSDLYKKLASIQLHNQDYNELVVKYMNDSYNYPTACSKALHEISEEKIELPNDILGLAYTKAIMKNDYAIDIHTIKRTNDYHSKSLETIASATGIRNALLNNVDVKLAVPRLTYELLNNQKLVFTEKYFDYLKYRIIVSSVEELANINLVTEGIENRIKSVIHTVNSYDELVQALSTKRYTYARISRVLMYILLNITKNQAEVALNEKYYRVLGFSAKGQKYLSDIKSTKKFLTTIKNQDAIICEIEYRSANIYKLFNDEYHENSAVIIEKQ